MGTKMKNQFVVFVLAGLLITCIPTAWSSDAASDKAQVEQQSAILPELKKAIVETTGIDNAKLNVKSTVHQITITIIDGKLNTASRLDREAEAQKIASRIESIISSKSEFSQIAIIHVDYVKSNGRKSKPVQGIDFNKSPAGSFPIHRT